MLLLNLSADLALPWHLETAFSMLFWYELGIVSQSHSLLNYFKEIKVFKQFCQIHPIVIISFTAGIISTFANFNITKTSLQVGKIYMCNPSILFGRTWWNRIYVLFSTVLTECHLAQKTGEKHFICFVPSQSSGSSFSRGVTLYKNLLAGGNSISAMISACVGNIYSVSLLCFGGWIMKEYAL
jgi:hypothetical protein